MPRHYLEPIPVADQVNGAGFRAEEVAEPADSGAFKFESVTPQQELRLARNDNYTSPWTGKPAHLDNLDLEVVRRRRPHDRRLQGE